MTNKKLSSIATVLVFFLIVAIATAVKFGSNPDIPKNMPEQNVIQPEGVNKNPTKEQFMPNQGEQKREHFEQQQGQNGQSVEYAVPESAVGTPDYKEPKRVERRIEQEPVQSMQQQAMQAAPRKDSMPSAATAPVEMPRPATMPTPYNGR